MTADGRERNYIGAKSRLRTVAGGWIDRFDDSCQTPPHLTARP